MKKITLNFLPLFVATTLMCGLVYVVVQQDIRQSANEPQIGMVNEIANEINWGGTFEGLQYPPQADPRVSTSPFVSVYDKDGLQLVSGVYGSDLPLPPKGVFEYVRAHGMDVFTWEPTFDAPFQTKLRIATVVGLYKHGDMTGFVLAARSLKEVEKREKELRGTMFVGWLVTIVITFTVSFYVQKKKL